MNFFEKLRLRREFFHDNYPIKIGRYRADVSSYNILKNSCPVCGYLTLDERDIFDICLICFWEDDGVDDFETESYSGPNNMTLSQGRSIFLKEIEYFMSPDFTPDDLSSIIRNKIKLLDDLILNYDGVDKKDEVLKIMNELRGIFETNRIFGLNSLFE